MSCKHIVNACTVNIQIKANSPARTHSPGGSDEEVGSTVGGGEVACGFVVSIALVSDYTIEDERCIWSYVAGMKTLSVEADPAT